MVHASAAVQGAEAMMLYLIKGFFLVPVVHVCAGFATPYVKLY